MGDSSSTRKREQQRGTAIVEAAFVTPVFLLLLFSIIEFGLFFRNHLTVTNATSQGARAASVGGNSSGADYFVLRNIEHGLSALDLRDLSLIVVYEARNVDDGPPAGCIGEMASSQPSTTTTRGCNVYTPDSLFRPLNDSDGTPTEFWGCGGVALDRAWCPSDRKATLSGTGPDMVGVYISVRHDMVTGFFGQSRVLEDHKVIRIEPERQQ